MNLGYQNSCVLKILVDVLTAEKNPGNFPRLFPTVDEDKTLFEPNYPISILICHTLGLSWAAISHHHSSTWQHVWLALSGEGAY